MKKDKHIMLNVTEQDYNELQAQADKEKRTLTNYTYLLITRALKEQKQWLKKN